MTEAAISVRDLKKSFDGATVLDGIDLDIPAGEVTLLMGENGSGKTILLSCLADGLHPTSGSISVFGSSADDTRSNMSFMLQGGLLFSELSGRSNGEFYADLHPHGTDDWEKIAERFDIADSLDDPVNDYSGGMVRKLELAITFGVDVPLYLLDEPTAELDLSAIDLVHALIEERRRDGHTIVLSSHTPADIQIADRIAFVRDGKIAATGSPEDLLETVPRVALARTRTVAESLREYVVEDQMFQSHEGRRGFIDGEMDEATLPDDVSIAEPSWTDLFNYYAHIDESAVKHAEAVPQRQ
ncbi:MULTISPECIES: ABC transporter ATP-binding protein [unclassified Haladaptatus]|uniref:ABC transporter ATP-binding protein n=1 Tax=unclassified Haladaptatus TaxID=2622732 RepID=UPI00209C2DF5|nr:MULTISPECIES: ABC transporter ATP-binding protein [unclassified Haladaptatus]MCO8244338.1 ABC transporter ATP-binding protein [Haladaptatus sp. AB643]MCO8254038.1 ABC transporter ATP-binding protein [Haladaptatus sp. AB618]